MANEKIFTIKINGVEKSFNDVTKLVDALKKLDDANISVSTSTNRTTETSRSKTQALTEEEKAAKKLEQTLARRKQLETDTAREQIAANQSLRERTQELQRSVQLESASNGSVDEMRLRLAQLGRAYRALSEEERNSAQVGGAMLQQIQDLRAEYNQLERELGNHAVNVGNYESASDQLRGTLEGLGQGIRQTAEQTKGMLNLFQTGIGFMALFGGESESTKKMMSDLSKVLAIVGALQAANNALLTNGSLASKANAIMTGILTIQEKAKARAIALSTSNTIAATIAQKAFNIVAKANPYVLLAMALITVVGALVAYKSGADDATESTKKYNSNIDGLSFSSEEARDAHDDLVRSIRDIQIEIDVASGKITAYQGELMKLANSTGDALDKAKAKTKKELDAINDEYGGFYNKLRKSFTNFVKGRDKEASLAHIEKEEQEVANQATIEGLQTRALLATKYHEEIKNKELKHNKERVDFQDKLTSELKTGQDKELFDLQNQRNKDLDNAKNYGEDISKVYEVYAKKENDIKEKYRKEVATKSKAFSDKQKQLSDSVLKYQEETTKLEIQNELDKITSKRSTIKVIEELKQSYADQLVEIKKQNEQEKQEAEKQYNDLLEKAKGNKSEIEKLNEIKAKRIKVIEEKLSNDLLKLKTEEQEAIKELNQKIVQNRKESIDLELAQLDTFYKEIELKLDDLESRQTDKNGKKGIINVEATRKNIQEANLSLNEYLKNLASARQEVSANYDTMLSMYDKDSNEYKQILLEKQNVLLEFQRKEKDTNDKITENMAKNTDLQKQYWQELTEKIQEYTDKVMQGVTAIFDAANTLLQSELDEAQDKFDSISEKYDEVVEKRKESSDKLKSLEDEAKEARGGRLIILQNQISQEMAANEQLASQESHLKKEKEKAEKEVAQKEKQMKRSQLLQQIAEGIANTALGVTKAYAASPLTFGLPWSAFVAASGAFQVGVMTKRLAKLEDGGLLKGKRHSQGGMRIEGTNIEVEGDEFVINRISTNKNLGLIDYINSQKRELTSSDITSYFEKTGRSINPPIFKRMFADGGQIPSTQVMNNVDNDRIIEAIKAIDLKPIVSVTDINKVNSQLVNVADNSNLKLF